MTAIVLFDGVCNLCNQSVQFILRHDKSETIQFTSLQSSIGQKLLKQYQIPTNTNSFIFIKNGKYHTKSNAALKVCTHFSNIWRILLIFKIIPTSIRDSAYDLLANNRYKLFGKEESCLLPNPKYKNRFLE